MTKHYQARVASAAQIRTWGALQPGAKGDTACPPAGQLIRAVTVTALTGGSHEGRKQTKQIPPSQCCYKVHSSKPILSPLWLGTLLVAVLYVLQAPCVSLKLCAFGQLLVHCSVLVSFRARKGDLYFRDFFRRVLGFFPHCLWYFVVRGCHKEKKKDN